MRLRLSTWLNTLPPIANPIEQQQAPSLLIFMAMLASAAGLWTFLPLLTAGTGVGLILGILAGFIVVVGSVGGILVLRKGHFTPSVIITLASLTVGVTLTIWVWGTDASVGMLPVFLMNVTLAGMLAERKLLLGTASISVIIIILLFSADSLLPQAVGIAPLRGDQRILSIGTIILTIGVEVALFLQAGASLRRLLQRTLQREFELDQLRASLEQTVTTRTASLQRALRDVEEREAALQQAMDALQSSQQTLRALSTPIVPVLPGILIVPLIGDLDSSRSEMMMEQVLAKVREEQASHVIIDITGVPLVDTEIARTLIDIGTALRLLGCDVILVGIRPEVAQTLISLNLSFGSLATFSDLQAAVLRLLPRQA